jgi:putative membrane protein insertion efficiency factor
MLSKVTVGLLVFYKKYISGFFVLLFGNACRFTPTCSEYSLQAFEKYGFIKGLNLTIKRILRCHPFSKVSIDPVP